jgi:hypothetical protein
MLVDIVFDRIGGGAAMSLTLLVVHSNDSKEIHTK